MKPDIPYHMSRMRDYTGSALDAATTGVSKIAVLLDEMRQFPGAARPEAFMQRMEKALEDARSDMADAESYLGRAIRSSLCES